MHKKSDDLLETITQKYAFIIVVAVLFFAFSLPGSSVSRAPAQGIGSVYLSEMPPEAGIKETEEDLAASGELYYVTYIIKKGDTISKIAEDYNVYPDAVITLNNLKSTRFISVGAVLKIPSLNGITYTVKSGDTLDKIAEEYKISSERIQEINAMAGDSLASGRTLFLPDARLPSWTLKEINGDLFLWPIRGYITNP